MSNEHSFKPKSILQLFDILPENERIIVDVVRQIILETLPPYCKEKFSYKVPFFYCNKSICFVWPSTIPRGGIKEGVLLGFWYGNKLPDKGKYLEHGTNKQIFYKIFLTPEAIEEKKLVAIVKEATLVDEQWKMQNKIKTK